MDSTLTDEYLAEVAYEAFHNYQGPMPDYSALADEVKDRWSDVGVSVAYAVIVYLRDELAKQGVKL